MDIGWEWVAGLAAIVAIVGAAFSWWRQREQMDALVQQLARAEDHRGAAERALAAAERRAQQAGADVASLREVVETQQRTLQALKVVEPDDTDAPPVWADTQPMEGAGFADTRPSGIRR